MILILMVEGAKAVISFCIRSAIPGYMVVPPAMTVLAYRSFLMSTSHFMMESPPCTPVLLTVCRRRSPPFLPPPSRSRSLLPLRESTLYGSVAPSCPPSPPSSRCGSPSRSTTSADPPLSTASASKCLPPADTALLLSIILLLFYRTIFQHFL